jgi:glyoxylase-like metal-dependent hydrolase (beta-lactamase superfamily II)
MNIETFIFNSIRTCMYVVWDDSKECVFVDAACVSDGERQRLDAFVSKNNLRPAAIYNTHAHPDHVAGNAYLCGRYGISAYMHPSDAVWLHRAAMHGASIGMTIDQPPAALPLADTMNFGGAAIEILHTPGHSKGCVCFYVKKHGIVFTGDTLFAGCIGRTDLADGNYDQIMHSIRTQLLTLPDDTRVFPGHGCTTDIRKERTTNPFLNGE